MTTVHKKRKCSVPFCTDTISARHRFPPINSTTFQIWLRNVNNPFLNNLQPKHVYNSYRVCESHFTPECIVPGTRRGLKLDAVPTLNLSDTVDSLVDTLPVVNSEIEKPEIGENNPCRLCMETLCLQANIFEKHNNSTTAELIRLYIPQIKITEDDGLSNRICIRCLDKISDFHKFSTNCIKNDRTQRQLTVAKRKCNTVDDNYGNYKKKRISDLKFEQIQSELMKVLDEDVSNQLKHSDNIIIAVESDNDDDDDDDEPLPDTVGNSDELPLPTLGIGSFDFEIIKNMYDTEFCSINDYLFSFQLKKANYCNLKCLTLNCPSVGIQNLLNNEIIIKIGHNHQIPTDYDKRKNMILYIIKKKLKNDKILNIRYIYEEICRKQPEIRNMLPLKTIMNHICSYKFQLKQPTITSFTQFYNLIEDDCFEKLHFTQDNVQFYQEKFATNDGNCKAIIFANCETIRKFVNCTIMYVDASFKIDTKEAFKYQLVTVLVWVDDSYYPILYALINRRSQEIYRAIFNYLHNDLAPDLKPHEIITDYEANLYYALSDVYCNSNIGGSVFYYTQNLYKKICSLHLTKDLESDSCIRHIYHMLLMLPLLPINTINDGLNNIEQQANNLNLLDKLQPLFDYIKFEWITNVTPQLFCVHRLENRINENVIAPFKKLRDFLMLTKSKLQKQPINIVIIIEKLLELEQFLLQIYNTPTKKSFARDLSSTQKKNVIKAWQFIENHPKINIVNFFTKVLGYIKCMENQLWIWGYYRYNPDNDYNDDDDDDELISAGNFSVISTNVTTTTDNSDDNNCVYPVDDGVVIEAVIDENNELVLKHVGDYGINRNENNFQNSYVDYVIKN